MKSKLLYTGLSVLLGLVCFQLQSQIILDRNSVDFGGLKAGDLFYADFELKNVGKEKVFILRAEEAKQTSVKYSNRTLAPQAKEFVRIQFNPSSTGSFERQIDVYLSSMDTPLKLSIKGDVESFNKNYDPACPDFSSPTQRQTYELKIFVGDELSYEALPGANFEIKTAGDFEHNYQVNQFGFVRAELPVGLYSWEVNVENYRSAKGEFYFNRNKKELNVYLTRSDDAEIQEEREQVAELLRDSVYMVDAGVKDSAVTLPNNAVHEVFISDYLPKDKYKPNNLVFLIDVSESMRLSGKIHLLRKAMAEMLDYLRPSDRIAIITYADSSTVLLPSTALRDKSALKAIVGAIEAKGKTAATQGLEQAYKMIYDNYIGDGNNQIFLSSDGVYSKRDTESAVQVVRANYGKGVVVSTLGIKAEKDNLKKLKKISRYGQGRSINLEEDASATKQLLNDIKRNSRIR